MLFYSIGIFNYLINIISMKISSLSTSNPLSVFLFSPFPTEFLRPNREVNMRACESGQSRRKKRERRQGDARGRRRRNRARVERRKTGKKGEARVWTGDKPTISGSDIMRPLCVQSMSAWFQAAATVGCKEIRRRDLRRAFFSHVHSWIFSPSWFYALAPSWYSKKVLN